MTFEGPSNSQVDLQEDFRGEQRSRNLLFLSRLILDAAAV